MLVLSSVFLIIIIIKIIIIIIIKIIVKNCDWEAVTKNACKKC